MALAPELVQECTRMLQGAQDGDRPVKTVHDVLALLEKGGHVYNIQLQPHMVGVSPLNRDGSGVNPVDVHDLLADILSAGWLDARVTAVGVEPSSQQELDWNSQFFNKTEGTLGTLVSEPRRLSHKLCLKMPVAGTLASGRGG